MGNRTAVQIRSHAQKFFSKVVRESSQGTEGGPIEIPPPRAKRKPTRRYPRKVSVPLKNGAAFHDMSKSNHDNMSPGPVSTTLPWNSMPTLAPECPRTRSLSGYVDLSYCILQSSGRIEPTTQYCSLDSENGEFGDKVERYAKGFVAYKSCLAEESSVLTGEEREELRVRLCL
ncbi:putative Myb domain-containing protein [Helianthus anomalus]